MIDRERALKDLTYYANNCLYIRTEDKRIINLDFNTPQTIVHDIIESIDPSKRERRFIILKARREGVSTYVGARMFWNTATNRNVSTIIMAHQEDPSVELFNMYSLFYKKLPPDMRPITSYTTKKELIFANKRDINNGLNSALHVLTANSSNISRTRTVHNLHWSEVAFTENAEETHTAIIPTIPLKSGALVVYESTANGNSGLFYDIYTDAVKGKNDWIPIFLPWFVMKEYSLPVDKNFVMSSEEENIKKRYNLSLEQIHWRRWKIKNDFGGKTDRFMQEYPAEPEEAFTKRQGRVFDSDILAEMERFIEEPKDIVEATATGLSHSEFGAIKIYRFPENDGIYLLACDAAGGKESGTWLVCQVMKKKIDGTLEQVAVYSEKISPILFAAKVAKISSVYNNGLIIPESNYHGVAVIQYLTNLNPPARVYYSNGDFGIMATRTSVYLLVNSLSNYILSRKLILHDRDTLEALKNYAEVNGKFKGNNDDYVEALRLATYVASSVGFYDYSNLFEPKKERRIDEWTYEEFDSYIDRMLSKRGSMYGRLERMGS